MKKIIYNCCHGGFGLSPLATNEFAKLKGIQLYFYKRLPDRRYEFVEFSDIGNYNSHQLTAATNYLGETTEKIPNGSFWYSDIKRDDLDLISVIEKLGDTANGACADLRITTVSGKWRIDEYDGAESVETPDSYDWND